MTVREDMHGNITSLAGSSLTCHSTPGACPHQGRPPPCPGCCLPRSPAAGPPASSVEGAAGAACASAG